MDLEFKILREKVKEEENKQGIGSLYDDDKTSHQHINLLKTKYARMLRDSQRNMAKLQKQELEVQGETFVLKAHLDISKEQNSNLKHEFDGYLRESQQEIRDTNKQFQGTYKETNDLNQEQITLTNELADTRDTRF